MAQQSKYLNLEGVVIYTTICRSVIYKLIKEGSFPRQYKIKGVDKRVVWSVCEIDDWMQKNLVSSHPET